MALIDILNQSLNQFNDTDDAWRQFISDHKTYLLTQAQPRTISPAFFQAMTYNLTRFLRSFNYDTHCAWIVALINDLPNDVAFTNITLLQVPPLSVIEELYTTYLSAQQNLVT